MYLIDTNVISEARKEDRANRGVTSFFREATASGAALFLPVVTVGELRRAVALMHHRGDAPRSGVLERWLQGVLDDFVSTFSASTPTPRRSGGGCGCRIPPVPSTS